MDPRTGPAAPDRGPARRVVAATAPGTPGTPNEDWYRATADLVVVLDGVTARTATGCRHGVPWYAARLGAALARHAADPATPLPRALAAAIAAAAAAHPDCDPHHPGAPAAAVAVLRLGPAAVEYLVLGDATVVLDTGGAPAVVHDDRVAGTAAAERAAADRLPPGPAKRAALVRMKHAELAARNTPGGYWIAAADPAAAAHARTGARPAAALRRAAVLTDGAARAVTPFGLLNWPGALDLLDRAGPAALLGRVRAAEAADPAGARWPRNKPGDDATAAFVGAVRGTAPAGSCSRGRSAGTGSRPAGGAAGPAR
ncbi:hypothetical protein GCM10010123_12610 [Pilimelia anulata]|uniref:PPM-type phosphatase domain-containing protein n=1 Tax=Pilimelia anulata TaxID=53371 RepID=A0A8J3B5J2_9ACTN|nr:hypothetical protein [Pilimelia anulata]GGJ84446.1 hypothetical protein GCM10010123_12610 [Pilimelia anulata]